MTAELVFRFSGIPGEISARARALEISLLINEIWAALNIKPLNTDSRRAVLQAENIDTLSCILLYSLMRLV